MRAVVQRVSEASVSVDEEVRASIGKGLLVYAGVDREDSEEDATYLARKVRHLRIFPDSNGLMNLDVVQAEAMVLVVSAFTVQADARRGRRPSFESAAPPEQALSLYEHLCNALEQSNVQVARGSFGDYMNVTSINAGPVCILLDSRRVF